MSYGKRSKIVKAKELLKSVHRNITRTHIIFTLTQQRYMVKIIKDLKKALLTTKNLYIIKDSNRKYEVIIVNGMKLTEYMYHYLYECGYIFYENLFGDEFSPFEKNVIGFGINK